MRWVGCLGRLVLDCSIRVAGKMDDYLARFALRSVTHILLLSQLGLLDSHEGSTYFLRASLNSILDRRGDLDPTDCALRL